MAAKSLLRSLNIYVSVVVTIAVIFCLGLFVHFSYKTQIEERKSTLQAIGATLGKLIARPLSVGDYVVVEHYLNEQGLPNFIESIVVRDGFGRLLAGHENSDGLQCSQTMVSKVLLDGGALASPEETNSATMNVVASYCDIEDSTLKMTIALLIFGLIIMLIVPVVTRTAVSVAFRPLLAVVDAETKRDRIDGEVLDKAPVEIRPLIKKLHQLYDKLVITESKSRVVELATQVAHDIRSPLAALDVVVKSSNDLPDQKRVLIRASVTRIREIADNLLTKNSIEKDSQSTALLLPILRQAVDEKSLEYVDRRDVRLAVVVEGVPPTCCANLRSSDLLRILSNLLNNAIEAKAAHDLLVTLAIADLGDLWRISVRDNGRGMALNVLSRIGERGLTIGKANGNGLGLYDAKQKIEAWGGHLSCESVLNAGTGILIDVPKAAEPPWLLPVLELSRDRAVVVVDDDVSIHAIWRAKLSCNPVRAILSINELYELLHKDPDLKEALFLIDYELGSENGLNLISNLQINNNSVLVTNSFDESSVRLRAIQMGIRILPKPLLGDIVVRVT